MPQSKPDKSIWLSLVSRTSLPFVSNKRLTLPLASSVISLPFVGFGYTLTCFCFGVSNPTAAALPKHGLNMTEPFKNDCCQSDVVFVKVYSAELVLRSNPMLR